MPSAVIQQIDYNSAEQVLTISYQSGSVYAYKGVPEQVYFNMRSAFSKGEFLNKEIKGKYEYIRVDRR